MKTKRLLISFVLLLAATSSLWAFNIEGTKEQMEKANINKTFEFGFNQGFLMQFAKFGDAPFQKWYTGIDSTNVPMNMMSTGFELTGFFNNYVGMGAVFDLIYSIGNPRLNKETPEVILKDASIGDFGVYFRFGPAFKFGNRQFDVLINPGLIAGVNAVFVAGEDDTTKKAFNETTVYGFPIGVGTGVTLQIGLGSIATINIGSDINYMWYLMGTRQTKYNNETTKETFDKMNMNMFSINPKIGIAIRI